MLTESAISAVQPLVDQLERNGTALNVATNTPLHALINSMCSGRTEETSIWDLHEISRVKNQQGVSPHDLTMDEMVGVIAETVSGNIHVARNVVNPIIRDVIADVEQQVEEMATIQRQPLEIVQDNYLSIWNSSMLVSLVDPYKETPYELWKPAFRMSTLPYDELAKLAFMGSDSIDQDLKETYGELTPDRLTAVYKALFVDYDRDFVQRMLTPRTSKRPVLIMMHFMARQLKNNVPDGVDASLGEYELSMNQLIAQTGRTIYRLMEERARQERNGMLVKSYPTQDQARLMHSPGTIVVNGDVYTRWLDEQGGSPEILMGAALADRPMFANEFDTNDELYPKKWKQFQSILDTKVRLERRGNIMIALSRAIAKQIDQLDDIDGVVPAATMHASAKRMLEHYQKRPIDNIAYLARKVVCAGMFAHTDACLILDTIDIIKQQNPEMDIREAALQATIEIVAAWVAEMIMVGDHSLK